MNENYFALFGLSPTFNIDLTTLENRFRKVQSEAHPDRFVSGTDTEKLQSMQIATTANEAYTTLKSPALRAAYLLSLQNINAVAETNTAMPAGFLMRQMEWRETLEDAKQAGNIEMLERLLAEMRTEAKSLQTDLGKLFDEKEDLTAACETTRKLIFTDKVIADINKAIEILES